ncbi:MAG: tRNA dihydrouridine synthase DusB [Clostridiales bacterium]|nr:tRNA dihydrouridine synthase DusB [Clostridiales bacterium]
MNGTKKIYAGLSPMAGFTDMPFRRICTEFGADYTVSEMISAAAICYGDKKTKSLCGISPDEGSCALQIFGHDPAQMSYAADTLTDPEINEILPFAVEINMGCPVRKIVTSGDGSALMKTPELAAEITRAVSDVLRAKNIPLWVKIRAGWDKNSINAPYFAALIADSGASRITIHGRTREQMYAPSSDNGIIREVRRIVDKSVPVIGNGDINSAEDAVRMIDETECDGVSIGRAACGNPWIFKNIRNYANGDKPYIPSVHDKIECALLLTAEVIRIKGEAVGIREARGRAAHFIRGIHGSAQVRDLLNHAESYDEFAAILRSLK